MSTVQELRPVSWARDLPPPVMSWLAIGCQARSHLMLMSGLPAGPSGYHAGPSDWSWCDAATTWMRAAALSQMLGGSANRPIRRPPVANDTDEPVIDGGPSVFIDLGLPDPFAEAP